MAENGNAATTQSTLIFLRDQHAPFRAAHIETMRRNGQPVLVIEFAAPTPLGLINSANP